MTALSMRSTPDEGACPAPPRAFPLGSALRGSDKRQRLSRQRQPFLLRRWRKSEPLLHHPAIAARIKTLAVAGGNQRVHPLPGQLHDQPSLSEHGKDFVVNLQP